MDGSRGTAIPSGGFDDEVCRDDTFPGAMEQGPNALTGGAAAAEEAAAQRRLLNRSPPSTPTAGGCCGRLRVALETHLPTMSILLFGDAGVNPRVPPGFEPELAVVAGHSDSEECAICLAPLGSCVTTPCGHSFHAACLEQYFITAREHDAARARCPLCRQSVHAPLPLEVRAVSGRPIEVTSVPTAGGRCHFDRPCTRPGAPTQD